MTLREHLDRYCLQRAMANDSLPMALGSRSRSPARATSSASTCPFRNVLPAPEANLAHPSPFYRTPGWVPPRQDQDRPILVQIDLKPMQQMATRDGTTTGTSSILSRPTTSRPASTMDSTSSTRSFSPTTPHAPSSKTSSALLSPPSLVAGLSMWIIPPSYLL